MQVRLYCHSQHYHVSALSLPLSFSLLSFLSLPLPSPFSFLPFICVSSSFPLFSRWNIFNANEESMSCTITPVCHTHLTHSLPPSPPLSLPPPPLSLSLSLSLSPSLPFSLYRKISGRSHSMPDHLLTLTYNM